MSTGEDSGSEKSESEREFQALALPQGIHSSTTGHSSPTTGHPSFYGLEYTWKGHEYSRPINPDPEIEGIGCVKFSPSGESIACVGKGILKVWDAAGRLKKNLASSGEINFSEVDWSKDGNLLVSGAENRCLKIWNFDTGRCVKELEHKIVYSAKFSPDGSLILSGSDDCTVKIWNAESGVRVRVLHLKDAAEVVDFNHDGRLFTTSGPQCAMYDFRTRNVVQDFTEENENIVSAKFFPDSRYMLCSMRGDGSLSLYDMRNRKVARIYASGIDHFGESFFNISFTASGEFIVRGSASSSIYIWEANTQDLVQVLEGHSDAVQCVDCHPGTNRIVSGSSDNSIKTWKIDS